MIDFHSHILPKLDDGSGSAGQSLDMLRACESQNIDTIVASPHFYRDRETVDSFIERRGAAFQELQRQIPEGNTSPRIVLAAEVGFSAGISYDSEIEKLCIGKSRCLMLEMPFEKWERRIFHEVRSLLLTSGVTVIIAHVERYFRYQNKKRDLYNLIDMGAILQLDTNIFGSRAGRRTAFNLLKIGDYFVLGTDCHNMDDRSPDFGAACEVITAKLGIDKLNHMNALSESLISDMTDITDLAGTTIMTGMT